MSQTQSAALLNRGLKQLSNPEAVQAFTFIGIPLGSRLLIIKQDEVKLQNPLFHTSDKLENDVYNYQKSDAYISTGTKLYYDVIFYNVERNLYYAIASSHTYNKNNTYHYYLTQLDISNILILNGLDDPRFDTIQNELYDVISTPELLSTFERHNIEAYPKNLQVLNRELIERKAVFIHNLDNYTLANGFSKKNGLYRKDLIRLYYNNYTLEEIYDLFETFNTMARNGELNLMDGNIFSLKQVNSDGLVGHITFYSEFNINYKLEPRNPQDLRQYIKSVMVKINDIRQKGE